MSLNDLSAAIDALPDVAASVTNGTLTVSAENPANIIAFGLDGSDSLMALGVNGFFTGTDAHTIGVDPLRPPAPSGYDHFRVEWERAAVVADPFEREAARRRLLRAGARGRGPG
jgi:hypothetical protein